jgi:hypothetical protein
MHVATWHDNEPHNTQCFRHTCVATTLSNTVLRLLRTACFVYSTCSCSCCTCMWRSCLAAALRHTTDLLLRSSNPALQTLTHAADRHIADSNSSAATTHCLQHMLAVVMGCSSCSEISREAQQALAEAVCSSHQCAACVQTHFLLLQHCLLG